MSDRIPTKTVVQYGAGQLGAQIFRDTPAVLLPLFMTTILGVPAWLAGIVVLIPKLWLIVCDPLVGAWSDRLKTRIGRTPFLLVGAICTSLGFLSLFTITDYASPLIAAAAICALFFVASTAFSIYSVPYLAIASELSLDPHERTRILLYRMLFTILGVLIGVGVAQPLVFALGGGAYGWHVMAIILSIICLIAMLVPAIGLRGARMLPGTNERVRLIDQLAPAFRNRPFVVLLTTCFIQNIGQAAGYTVIGFVFLYALGAIWLIPLFILVMSAGSLLSQPFWLAMSRRYGKQRCYIAASVVWAAVTISWFWIHPGTDALVHVPGIGALATQHVLVLVRALIIGITNSGFLLLALSLLTDTVDHQRQRFGSAHEGVFAGIFSAAEKLSFALGPVLSGVVLSLFGFAASTGGAAAQSDSAIFGIILLYSLVPAATQVISLLVFSRYSVEDRRAAAAASPIIL